MNLGQIVATILRNANQTSANPNDPNNIPDRKIAPQIAPIANARQGVPPVVQANTIRPRVVSAPPQIETLNGNNIPSDTINVPNHRTLDSALANLPPIQNEQPQTIQPDVQTETPITQNTGIRPRIAGDSRQWEIEQNRRMISDPALENIPENKPNRFKAALGLALKEIGDTIRNRGSLGQALGAGGAAAGAGALSPKLFADAQHQNRIDRLQTEVDQDFKNKERELGLEAKQAQIDYTKERPAIEREKLRNRIELEKERQNNKIANLKMQNANKEDDWDSFIRDGKVWKMYKNRDGGDGRPVIEPLIDPDTGAQMQPAEDQLYEVWSETAGRYVKAKGRDALGVDMANAGRETSVNLANASAQNRYQNDLFDWQNKVGSAGAEVSAKDNELVGVLNKDAELSTRENQILNEIGTMQGDLFKADQVKEKQNELEKVRNERANLTAQKEKLKGEVEKAKQNWESLKNNRPKAPTAAQAVTTGKGGKYAGQVFASPASLKSYFPNKTEAEIKQIVEANGGRFNQ